MAKLSAAARRKLPAHAFVYPATRSYPIHDHGHAVAALSDSKGTPQEAAVMAAVAKRYPGMKMNG